MIPFLTLAAGHAKVRISAAVAAALFLAVPAAADEGGKTVQANAPPTFRDCATCPEMVVVPAGRFEMGDLVGTGQDDERPTAVVAFASSFAIGRFEVTRGEYGKFVESTRHATRGGCNLAGKGISRSRNWTDPGFRQTGRDPVACVSWLDARAYVTWLSRTTGRSYRLPSEAEWEYAARAGGAGEFFFGSQPEEICRYGNAADASSAIDGKNMACSDGVAVGTAPVGSYRPNGFGLYDVLGNVSEWTADCYRHRLSELPRDGRAWTSPEPCSARSVRGSAWDWKPWYLRTSNRGRGGESVVDASIGFRVAASPRTD